MFTILTEMLCKEDDWRYFDYNFVVRFPIYLLSSSWFWRQSFLPYNFDAWFLIWYGFVIWSYRLYSRSYYVFTVKMASNWVKQLYHERFPINLRNSDKMWQFNSTQTGKRRQKGQFDLHKTLNWCHAFLFRLKRGAKPLFGKPLYGTTNFSY